MTATFKAPTTPAEFQLLLEDDEIVAGIASEGGGALRQFVENYTNALDDSHNTDLDDLRNDVSNQVDTAMAEFMKEKGLTGEGPAITQADVDPSTKKMLNYSTNGVGYNPAAAGAQLDHEDYTVNDYFKAANVGAISGNKDRQRLLELRNKVGEVQAFTGTSPSDGGLLVPETMRSEIMTLALESAVVRPRAKVVTITGKLELPFVEDKDRSGGDFFGGVQIYWGDEAEEATATSPKWGSISVEPHELIARAVIPKSLLDDVAGLSSWVAASYPEAMGVKEDRSFISGPGGEQPLGFLDADATINVTRTTASKVKTADILKMRARLLPGASKNTVWVANQTAIPELATLSLDVGTGGAPVNLFNIGDNLNDTLLGSPVIYSEKMKALGTAGDLMLVDLSRYLIADRQALELSVSEHAQHSTAKTQYRFISRVDGRPLLTSAVTPENGDTLSPFIKLN